MRLVEGQREKILLVQALFHEFFGFASAKTRDRQRAISSEANNTSCKSLLGEDAPTRRSF